MLFRVIFIQIPNNILIYLFLFDIILLIKGGFKINYKEKKIINKISFILIGLFVIAIGFYNLHSSREFFKTAKTTSATITNINKTQRIEKKKNKRKTVTEYSFIITYNINGTEYSDIDTKYYDSKKNIGDSIIIYYQPNNPINIRCEKNTLSQFFMISIWGIALILIGIFSKGHIKP